MAQFTESVVEDAALVWLESLGWQVMHGPDIAPETPATERVDYGQVVLEQRLRNALARLNPNLPVEVLDDPDQVTLAVLSHTLLLKLLSDEIYIRDTAKLTEAEV